MDGGGSIVVRAGFGFHKNVNAVRRPPVPTRNKGFQLTLEADVTNPWNMGSDVFWSLGPNLVLGYKLNPNLSFGLGYGLSGVSVGNPDILISKEYNRTTTEGGEIVWPEGIEIDRSEKTNSDASLDMHKFFIRGQYRLNDNRFSPIASVDLGYRTLSHNNEVYRSIRMRTNQNREEYDEDYEYNKSSLFVNPAIGFSLRTTNNSYFEMKLGYALYGKIDGKSVEYHNTSYHRYTLYEQKESKLSGAFLTIGWTHTFGSRKK